MIKPLVGILDDGPGRCLGRPQPVRGLHPRAWRFLRDQPALRPDRPLRDGRLRDRRGRPELRGRRRRSRRGSRSSTTSAGATPSGPRPWARSSVPPKACRDVALAYGTPFISGKDSLYNEYTHEGQSLAIPPTLLISAMGIVPDIRSCVTMDAQGSGQPPAPGWDVTSPTSWAGSHWADGPRASKGGRVPRVNLERAPDRSSGRSITAISRGLVRSCHDLSEGGLAVGPGRDGDGRRPRRRSSHLIRGAPRWRDERPSLSLCSPSRRLDSSWKSGPRTPTRSGRPCIALSEAYGIARA